MSESAKRLKANKVMEGRPCGSCGAALTFGVDAAACMLCSTAHHAECWDRAGGCSKVGCANAPLRQLEAPPEPAQVALRPGMVACPHCGHVYAASRGLCTVCKRAPTATGRYTGPRTNAPGSVEAMVYGILSLLICAPIFGPLAISKAKSARAEIARNPRCEGEGLATAGTVLGIVGLVLWVLVVLLKVATR